MWKLPPEFLRKGCFNEVFFLDLPKIARATEGFVGAELEAVVNDAMFPAFMDGKRELVLSGQARNASRAAVI